MGGTAPAAVVRQEAGGVTLCHTQHALRLRVVKMRHNMSNSSNVAQNESNV